MSNSTDVAKNQAADVKDTAVDAGRNVAGTAKDEVANVAAEAKTQAKDLFGSMTSEVESQAGAQQQKIAATVSSLAKELAGMAEGSDQSGPLTDLAKKAADKGDEVARWLENNEPRDVLTQVSSFARRRPVMFLGLCFLTGVVAGRFSRAAAASHGSDPATADPRRALDAAPEPRPTGATTPMDPAEPIAPPEPEDQLRAGAPGPGGPASAWNEPTNGESSVRP